MDIEIGNDTMEANLDANVTFSPRRFYDAAKSIALESRPSTGTEWMQSLLKIDENNEIELL